MNPEKQGKRNRPQPLMLGFEYDIESPISSPEFSEAKKLAKLWNVVEDASGSASPDWSQSSSSLYSSIFKDEKSLSGRYDDSESFGTSSSPSSPIKSSSSSSGGEESSNDFGIFSNASTYLSFLLEDRLSLKERKMLRMADFAGAATDAAMESLCFSLMPYPSIASFEYPAIKSPAEMYASLEPNLPQPIPKRTSAILADPCTAITHQPISVQINPPIYTNSRLILHVAPLPPTQSLPPLSSIYPRTAHLSFPRPYILPPQRDAAVDMVLPLPNPLPGAFVRPVSSTRPLNSRRIKNFQQSQNAIFSPIKPCGYCVATNKTPQNHSRKKCPELAKLKPCKVCRASGTNNHTLMHCPMKEKIRLALKCKKVQNTDVEGDGEKKT